MEPARQAGQLTPIQIYVDVTPEVCILLIVLAALLALAVIFIVAKVIPRRARRKAR